MAPEVSPRLLTPNQDPLVKSSLNENYHISTSVYDIDTKRRSKASYNNTHVDDLQKF